MSVKLPIQRYLDKISGALSSANNVVLQAEPGAGKSTVLPLHLLKAKNSNTKKILMLEPRRVAAKSIAHYLAKQLGEKVGQRVGYKIKNERRVSNETILEIVTEGILTRRLQSDPGLRDVGLIIFDEFHERSIHADLALMLALEVQQTIRDDLKLLVMSATIDVNKVAGYMKEAEIIECPGRAFPVSVSYHANTKKQLVEQVASALRVALNNKPSGDVLVFLPGQSDISRCMARSQELLADTDALFLPLYGALSLEQQEKALVPEPSGTRRIVFTTNIAETSLTIEGVTCVIDCGLEKGLVYDPVSGMTRLDTQYISKASAEQRKGRAGRTQSGTCIRLWSEEKHRTLKEFQSEEILSADLTNTLLELSAWGTTEYESINWLTPPPKAHYDSAKTTLVNLELLDANGQITSLGIKAAALGLPPRLSAILLKAKGKIEQGVASELAALLADRDIFHQSYSVDIVERLLAVQEYKLDKKAALKSYPLKRSSVEQLLASASNFRRTLKLENAHSAFFLSDLQLSIGTLLLHAFPERLAKKRSNADSRYLLANGRGVCMMEADPLLGSEWLVVADCDAQKNEGRIYSASAISEDTVLSEIADKLEEVTHIRLDSSKEKIIVHTAQKYGAIQLGLKLASDVSSNVFRNCLKEALKEQGLGLLNWTPRCEELLSRIEWLSEYVETFPQISHSSLIESVEDWLFAYMGEINSVKALKKLNTHELLIGMLSWDEQQLLDKEAPKAFIAPSNKVFPIIYDKQQGPTVSVQLQEVFGQIDSPRIGGGKVPIRFKLLSPAKRPIQITSDLTNFWNTSYFEIAKDMRSRYPKHRWPEKPLLEKAGRSIKLK